MIKTKKWLLAVSIALVGMIVSLLISFFPSIVEAKAETKYFSAEQYTEDDGLLQEDGSHSLTPHKIMWIKLHPKIKTAQSISLCGFV